MSQDPSRRKFRSATVHEGLLRASALRFRQDYAAIGLHTVLTLSHPLPV